MLVAACGPAGGTVRQDAGRVLDGSRRRPCRVAEHAATPRDPKLSTLENLLRPMASAGRRPRSTSPRTSSPYRLAIRVEATAVGDGLANSMWFGGWGKLDEDADGGRRTVVDRRQPRRRGPTPDKWSGLRPDPPLGRSAPVTFREDGSVIPVVELQVAEDMKLERVDRRSVVGHRPRRRGARCCFGWQSALIGLVMLVLWFRWFRKREVG